MRYFRYFLIFILGLMLFFDSTSDFGLAASETLPSGIAYDELEKEIDAFVEEHEKTTVGMEAAVFSRDDILFQKEYGYVNKEEKKQVNKDSVLGWGSITKTLIWVSAMQLWEEGKLDLEADICDYLPEGYLTKLRYDTPITMLDLMNHKGGFQESYTDMYLKNIEDVLPLGEQIKKHQPVQVFEPGTVTSYSNWGSALAAYVVERVSGQSYAAYVKEHIFEPLQMDHTAILPDLSDREGVLEKRLETLCYTNTGEKRPVSFYHISLYPCGMCAGTLSDFILYAQALMPDESNPSPLFKKTETLEQLFTPTSYIGDSENARICHGFLVNYYAVPVLGHGGNSYGCSARMLIDPASGIGTVVMVNQYLEEVYTDEMMSLIYGTYDGTSNLDMPTTEKNYFLKVSRTFWEGPFKLIGLGSTTIGTPDNDIPWMELEGGNRIELADITDCSIISPLEYIIENILFLLMCVIAVYLVVIGGIGGLIVRPIKRGKLKKKGIELSPDLTARWHYASCGLMAVWLVNLIILIYQMGFANALCTYYQWQIALNGILCILMLVAFIWFLLHKKTQKQKGASRRLPYVTGFCLLSCVINIVYWDMYQFWNI